MTIALAILSLVIGPPARGDEAKPIPPARGGRAIEVTYVRDLPTFKAFVCIHEHEGAWNDPYDPYWGGLQMDRTFMLGYGRDMIRKYNGWAHLWSPADQIRVAHRAWKTRGYHPWPMTARMCGLI